MSQLTDEEFEKYREAGRIVVEVMRKAKKLVSKGRKLLTICEVLEQEIIRLGAKPAFPVNVSVNQIAAHYTSPIDDELKIPERAIIKIDLGAHVDGYISDHAKTFLVGGTKTYQKLKKTAELALQNAVDFIKPGVRPNDIGEVIEKTIRNEGLIPITDLTGHVIERWKLHTGTSIPNYKPTLDIFGSKLKLGQVLAIEPFVTTSEGSEKIYDESYSFIFSQIGKKAKSDDGKVLLKEIEQYNRLPFALRWLKDLYAETRIFEAIKELISYKTLNRYPMLVSKSQTPVAQAEHTVIITEDGCEVITKL
ncbi:MAG: type II methionyl aminopeptidase [Candidatus Heimdallarchaeota archaeon]|nr:type II methionyl aminopeptidase [Candidatus Heimdallarchaeota archaeon]MBY8993667.1 type II methionyl aminopeptidase [Candidatus Heimdallarchaeota archaeon]